MKKPATINDYILFLPDWQRETVQKVYDMIRNAVPKEATAGISWWVIMFSYHGLLIWLGAAKKHCALYWTTGTLVDQLGDELAKYDISKGTIRFPFDKPLPVALVKKIVKIRVKENEENWSLRHGNM
jgi:uncharacterized protein YdhG (YjbR/CyaY superfamily)